MVRIKARYRNGVFEPDQAPNFPDETEVELLVEPIKATFFDMAREIRQRVAASGASEEEIEKLINEEVHAVREEELRRGGEGGQ